MTDTELNEAVARKLGWDQCSDGDWVDPGAIRFKTQTVLPPPYSTDIKAAWEILDQFDYSHTHNIIARSPSSNGWHCQLNNGDRFAVASADTAPRAICEAFLKLEEK